MPLYKSIPLCSFDYTGDTLSSATFKYDTTHGISKINTKSLQVSNGNIIDKSKVTKLFYKDKPQIVKNTSPKYVYSKIENINKEYSVNLLRDDINILKDALSNKDLGIDIISTISKNKTKNVETGLIKKGIIINNAMELISPHLKEVNVKESIYFESPKPEIFKVNSNFLIQRIDKLALDKGNSIKFSYRIPSKNITKSTTNYLDYMRYFNIFKVDSRYMDRVIQTQIWKEDNHTPIKRVINSTDIYIDDVALYLSKYGLKNIDIDLSSTDLYKINNRSIIMDESVNNLSRININHMMKSFNDKLLNRLALTHITNIDNVNYLQSLSIKDIFPVMDSRYLDRLAMTYIFNLDNRYLNRVAITPVYKEKQTYLKRLPLSTIYKEFERGLLNITVAPIYKELSKSLKGTSISPIYKENSNRYIEVTKRWWWLNEKGPVDHLIVPNKDYDKIMDLLDNPSYEYLRHNYSTIDWGKSWGIDKDISPYGVSVEIMLDLVNILIMIWHHDIQAWLNCTGKEGIQFVMELIYDWYSMSTSRVNQSYLRAYRWIRWEAEKVYFLNMDNGLQSIGMLIGNLLEYMKNHHYNVAPLWMNPKAMDTEKWFKNPLYKDKLILYKDIDKIKGKRHYVIETQNFEKKDLFRR